MRKPVTREWLNARRTEMEARKAAGLGGDQTDLETLLDLVDDLTEGLVADVEALFKSARSKSRALQAIAKLHRAEPCSHEGCTESHHCAAGCDSTYPCPTAQAIEQP